jgi:hypothetical protein
MIKKDILGFKSRIINDYEILIKSNPFGSTAFCPQLNKIIKGQLPDDVKTAMNLCIDNYINNIPIDENEIIDEQKRIKIEEFHEKESIKEDLLKKASYIDRSKNEKIEEEISRIPKAVEKSAKDMEAESNYIIQWDDFDLDGYFFNPEVAI